jgi:hypothetical protein
MLMIVELFGTILRGNGEVESQYSLTDVITRDKRRSLLSDDKLGEHVHLKQFLDGLSDDEFQQFVRLVAERYFARLKASKDACRKAKNAVAAAENVAGARV